MKSLFGGLLIVTGAVAVAVGVLAGVERLLQNQDRRQRRRPVEENDTHADVPETPVRSPSVAAPLRPARVSAAAATLPTAVAGPTAAAAVPAVAAVPALAAAPAAKKDPDRNFSIKRTKSEVGYVYWILEGHGKYKCFVLCDSWDEAVAQAKAKLAEVDAVEGTTPAHAETVSMNA